MRARRRRDRDLGGLAVGEDTRYCVLCEAVMVFEQVDAGDRPAVGCEWVCSTCGSAVLIDPPNQLGVAETA